MYLDEEVHTFILLGETEFDVTKLDEVGINLCEFANMLEKASS